MAGRLRAVCFKYIVVFAVFSSTSASETVSGCILRNSSLLQEIFNSCNKEKVGNLSFKTICLDDENRPRTHTATKVQRCCFMEDCSLGIDSRNCSIPSSLLKDVQKKFNINYIIVNANSNCPFEDHSWSHITLNDTCKVCRQIKDSCVNVTCPANSHCVMNKTALTHECLCNTGWHGYRCLRNGKFSAIKWLSSIAGGTVTLIIMLWTLQHLSNNKKATRILPSSAAVNGDR